MFVWWQGLSKLTVVGCAVTAGLATGLAACDAKVAPPLARATLTENVKIEVLNPNRPQALRCNPDIRLDRKVSARTLEALSRQLLKDEAEDCAFGLATYYLPAMRPGSGAWAIAELGPEVSVSILGLSDEDEAALLRRAQAHPEALGVWVDDTSYASVMLLLRDTAGLKLTRFYLDGGTNIDPIRIAATEQGFELRPAGASRGRHYRIGSGGDLETWDGVGFLAAARKIRLDVDLAAVKSEDDAARAERARAASARGSQQRAAAQEERWRKFNDWLTIYETSLGPARHPVLSLTASKDAGDRAAACSQLVKILDRAPPDLGAAPSPSIDTAPLLASLDRLRQACAGDREIKVLLDAATVTSVWRTLERDVEKVVSQLRPVEE